MKRLLCLTSVFIAFALAIPLLAAVTFSANNQSVSDLYAATPPDSAAAVKSENGDNPIIDVPHYIDDKTRDEDPDIIFEYFEDDIDYLGPNTDDYDSDITLDETTAAPETEAQTEAQTEEQTQPETTEEQTEEQMTEAETMQPTLLNKGEKFVGCDAEIVRVYDHNEEKYVNMPLGEYIFGVVAAEMPAYFELDALMAQAIACRTFTLYRMERGTVYDSSYHGEDGADVCTYSGHCQAYISYDEAVSKWGKSYANSIFDKVKQAVLKTSGIVATYDGEPIDAAYHSCSYKMTDSHVNVWTADYPYLVGVSTPETEDLEIINSTVKISSAKMKKIILAHNKKAELEADPGLWLDGYTLNGSGRIDTYTLCGVEFSGTEMRSEFELRSTNFKLRYDAENDRFIFSVYGWGHGVGLSQYGANIYAKQGYDYSYILTHYYTGIKLEKR